MFFSYQLLVRKNSSFAVIWRYMHDRSSRMKVTKKELLSVDINQACDDLRNYVPTGILAREELFNKMSLYLLAQLSYGVTLVLRVHAEYLIADLESFLKSLQRFPVEELVADGEIVKTPGHRKKRKVGDVALEELEQLAVKGVPAGEEDEEFEESRKKRRKSRITKPSLLNLNDPSAYVDHQVPGSAPRVQPIEDLNQLDDMFMDQSDIRLPPWPPLEGEEFPPTQHVPEEVARDVQPKQPKLSRATILSVGEESFMHELEMAIAGTPEEQQEEQQQGPQPIKEIAIPEEENPEPPIEHVREPIYRQNASMLEEDNIMLQQSLSLDHDIIRLEALPDVQQVPQRGPQRKVRRPKHLIVDEKMELTNEEMARNLADYSDTLRNREKFIEELRQTEREKMPTLKELLNPRPLFLPGISEELYPLFDTVLKEVYERPLTYEEGIRMTDDEMRVRRLPVDVATLSLRTTPTKDRTVDESIIQLQEISQLVPPTPTMEKAPKISVADFNPFVDDGQGEFEQPPPQQQEEQEQPPLRPSTPLEPEKTRHARETMQTLSSRATDLQPPLMEESYVQPMMELSLDAGDFIEDIQLQRESILVKPSPDEPEEGWLDEEMDQLYDAIVAEHNETQKPKLFYDDIVEKQEMKMSKKQAARKFYTLLKLLKHRKVKAQQRKGGYTPIEVRVPGIIAAEEKKKHRES